MSNIKRRTVCEREREPAHMHTTAQGQTRWLLLFFRVNIFFLSGYFAVNTVTPTSFHHLLFLLSLPCCPWKASE